MRLDAIRSFLKLVETGSYAAAADALFMSPTTLHSHVKTLEEELNTPLVSFEGRRLDLTRAGSEFIVFAERTISAFDALREGLSGMAHPPQTTLRIVSLPAPGTYLVPPVVQAFQAANPEVHVTVDTRRVGETLAALVSRQADLAIVHDVHAEQVRDVYEISPLFEDRLATIIRSDLYAPPDVALLERYPLAVQPPRNFSRQYIERWARQHDIQLKAQYEHAAFDGILSYVMSADCIGVVGGYVATLSPLAGLVRSLDLPEFDYTRRFVALYPARAGEAVMQFIDYFRSFYEIGARVGGRR
jgi:DNA-binding transcriptional LysR family regulator